MKCLSFALAALLLSPLVPLVEAAEDGWISLWDGKTFNGWKANENTDTFSIQDGAIVANGKRSHLFYVGDVNGGVFHDFELKVDVKFGSNSNGGVYFHTAYQDQGWPDKGFEVQVCSNGYKDQRKTGSLYGVEDIGTSPAQDGEWFTEHIVVKDGVVTTYVDGKKAIEWKQPADWQGLVPPAGQRGPKFPERRLDEGTFALQGHDPGSTVHYRNIRVKPLK